MNKQFILILLSCSTLAACTYTKQWKSNDTPRGTTASFNTYNGRNEYPVTASASSRFYVKFDVGLEQGTLGISLKSASGTAFDSTLSTAWTDSLIIDNPKRQAWRIRVDGRQASGHFAISSGSLGGN